MSEEENQEGTKLLGHVYDRFHEQHVVVQLRGVYYTVTFPGVPHAVPDEQKNLVPHRMPLVFGHCQIQKDERGNVRVVIERPDPIAERQNSIIISIDPADIEVISMAKEQNVIERVG